MDVDPYLPTVFSDIFVHSWQKSGIGELILAMEMRFDAPLNEQVLARAADLILDAEPVLGCRLNPRAPRWERLPADRRKVLTMTESRSVYARFRHSGLDAGAGPQLAICLGRFDDGDQMIIKLTHEVADGAALKDVAYRLSEIYTTLSNGGEYEFVPNTAGRRDLGQVIQHIPKRAYPGLIWSLFLLGLRLSRPGAQRLPSTTLRNSPWSYTLRRLSPESVATLVEYGRARKATLNDVILAACYRALALVSDWNQKQLLRIPITVDLRRWYLPSGRAGGICNLSSSEYPFLERNLGRDYEATLRNVTKVTSRAKGRWPGIGGLYTWLTLRKLPFQKLLQAPPAQNRKSSAWYTPLQFTNFGPIEAGNVRFGKAPVTAHILPPRLALPAVLVGLSGYEGTLTLSAGCSDEAMPVVDRFLDEVLRALPGAPASSPHEADALASG